MPGSPVPRRDLPPGVICAMASGPLTGGDLRAIEDFKEFLARTRPLRDEYAERLAAFHPTSPEHLALRRELNRRIQEIEADCMADDYTEGTTTQ